MVSHMQLDLRAVAHKFSLSRESFHNDVSQVLTHHMFHVKSDHPYFI